MNTLQFCELVNRKCVGFKSIPEILSIVNDAQNELLSLDCEFMRVKPDPFLETTDGVYVYNLDAGIRSASMVYTLDQIGGNNPDYGSRFPFEYYDTNQLGYPMYKVPSYRSEALSPTEQVTIKFDTKYNPNTTTETYRLICYSWPEQLTSTSIPLSIPPQYQTRVLLDRVMVMIEEESFGRSGDWDRKYDKHYSEFMSFLRSYNNIDEDTGITPWLG